MSYNTFNMENNASYATKYMIRLHQPTQIGLRHARLIYNGSTYILLALLSRFMKLNILEGINHWQISRSVHCVCHDIEHNSFLYVDVHDLCISIQLKKSFQTKMTAFNKGKAQSHYGYIARRYGSVHQDLLQLQNRRGAIRDA